MKLLIFPKNYTITIRDSQNELVGSTTITEQSPKTFLYSKKNSPTVFESIRFTHKQNDMIIRTKGEIFKEDGEIILGSDEEFAFFTFVETNEIEPMTALRNR